MPGIRLTQVSATTQSAVLPGVSTKAHGRHSSSTIAWTLLFRPPLVMPIACVSAPLSAAGAAMNFHMAAVEGHVPRHVGLPGDRSEHLLPNAPFAPARETVVDRLVRPVLTRAVLPATTTALHVHYAAQNPPIIFSLRPRLVARQMRLDPR